MKLYFIRKYLLWLLRVSLSLELHCLFAGLVVFLCGPRWQRECDVSRTCCGEPSLNHPFPRGGEGRVDRLRFIAVSLCCFSSLRRRGRASLRWTYMELCISAQLSFLSLGAPGVSWKYPCSWQSTDWDHSCFVSWGLVPLRVCDLQNSHLLSSWLTLLIPLHLSLPQHICQAKLGVLEGFC